MLPLNVFTLNKNKNNEDLLESFHLPLRLIHSDKTPSVVRSLEKKISTCTITSEILKIFKIEHKKCLFIFASKHFDRISYNH